MKTSTAIVYEWVSTLLYFSIISGILLYLFIFPPTSTGYILLVALFSLVILIGSGILTTLQLYNVQYTPYSALNNTKAFTDIIIVIESFMLLFTLILIIVSKL